jgi:nucleoside-diphosphate-sugar epimerase
MTSKRIFVTGASGCIGHYVVETLIQETNHELYLLVRNPDKLKVNVNARSGVKVLSGNLREIEHFSDLLGTIDCAVLIATAWGDPQVVHEINVVKTLQLMRLLNPEVCQQVLYFSTASILDRNNELLQEAGEIGTDYIRSKYACFRQLSSLAIYPKITTLFPTLLLGGDAHKPQSHVSSGIAQIAKWINLLRFLQADGSFHFIHGKDVAQIVHCLIDDPLQADPSRKVVLGNQMLTVDQAIEETCDYLNKRIYFRLPLTPKLANLLIALFRIKMAAWDRFSMRYRHFTHKGIVSPATFNLPTYCATFTDVLKVSGVKPKRW